jgi:hypothetical protein
MFVGGEVGVGLNKRRRKDVIIHIPECPSSQRGFNLCERLFITETNRKQHGNREWPLLQLFLLPCP